MKLKRTFLMLFYLLAAIIIGAMIANLCRGVSFLSWLSYSNSIGFSPNNPFVLDLSVFKLTFGFSFSVSVAQIITIAVAIFCYNKTNLR